jgi:hypothetical protein
MFSCSVCFFSFFLSCMHARCLTILHFKRKKNKAPPKSKTRETTELICSGKQLMRFYAAVLKTEVDSRRNGSLYVSFYRWRNGRTDRLHVSFYREEMGCGVRKHLLRPS